MLAGIHPILGAELLAALDRLGHGDEMVISDANFPAHRLGTMTIEAAGLSAVALVEAIRTVVPLDEYEGPAVLLMSPEDGELLPVQHELIRAAAGPEHRVGELARFAFYDRARTAQLIVRTGETRIYGNLILRKGVVKFEGRLTPA